MISDRNTRECRRGLKRCEASRIGRQNLLKDAVAAEEEMRKVREEIDFREARCLQLSNKSSGNRMAAEDVEEELWGLQAGEERRGGYASQANECCLDAVAEQLFTMGAARARQRLQVLKEKS